MKKFKVVITEKFSTNALVKLKQNSNFDVVKLISPTNFNNHHTDCDALIIRSKTKINSELLHQCPNLKLIITCTSGFDHIDLRETENKNITVMYTPDANARSAAELTFGHILNLSRHILDSHKQIKSGQWNQESREQMTGFELDQKTLGIIGLGRIGQQVAQFANAFGINIVVFDPYQDESVFQKLNLQRFSYEEVLKQSDLITFHVPLTHETKNMFNRSHIEYVQPHLIVINTSRGEVINEDDLTWALENKKIAAAGLDVFQHEPLSRDSKLLKLQNVTLTQHIGALTSEAFEKASLEASELCVQFFNHHKIKNKLPLENDWGSLTFNFDNKTI